MANGHLAEAKQLLRNFHHVAKRELGERHEQTVVVTKRLAAALSYGPDASLGDVREAEALVEGALSTGRKAFGAQHPLNLEAAKQLAELQRRARYLSSRA